jgi:hypothetical protein
VHWGIVKYVKTKPEKGILGFLPNEPDAPLPEWLSVCDDFRSCKVEWLAEKEVNLGNSKLSENALVYSKPRLTRYSRFRNTVRS